MCFQLLENGRDGNETGGEWHWERRLKVVGFDAEEGEVVMFFFFWRSDLIVKGKKKRKRVFGMRIGGGGRKS